MTNRPGPPELTVAFCTSGREASLRMALAAVLDDLGASGIRAEVMVVDDGDMGAVAVESLRAAVAARGHSFVVGRKEPGCTGLYESRRRAVALSLAPVILFLDDDADVTPGYVGRLLSTLRSDHGLVGLGGVDQRTLPKGLHPIGAAYARLFRLAGKEPGLLSPSGLNHSQATWRLQASTFDSQYLHGCNMAFHTRALHGLPKLAWLQGHSPCEDLVLSAWARRHGRLAVDPTLGVSHRHVPGGRGNVRQSTLSHLRSHVAFSAGFHPCSRLTLAWSLAGLCVKDLAKSLASREPSRVLDVAVAYAKLLADPRPERTRCIECAS